MNLRDTVKKILIHEISSKIVDKLVQKWTQGKDINPETAKEYIDEFSDISSSLPVEFRDITKLDFSTVSKIVEARRAKNRLKKLTTKFKKMDYPEGAPKPSNLDLKRTIKKYNDIYPFIKDGQRAKFEEYDWLKFLSKTNEIFERHFLGLMQNKITEENPNWTPEQIAFYLNAIIENYDQLPENTPPIYLLSMSEIEHIIDGLSKTEINQKSKIDVSDIPQVSHPKKNLTIYAPTGKPDCIRLKNGRSWCTSREGTSNLYYNYRFDQNLTLYYVIDEDLPFDHLNFATVILVDKNGEMRLADGSNSRRYAGSTILPWDEIVGKIPKLDGLKDLFEPKPLTEEENRIFTKLRRMSIPDVSLQEWFGDLAQTETSYSPDDLIELWMEINSSKMTDKQYASLNVDQKKKYIALGIELTPGQINSSENSVIAYYSKKQLEKILTKSIRELKDDDVSLLNHPMFKKLKIDLRDKFLQQLTKVAIGKNLDLRIDLDKKDDSGVGNFMKLYGLEILLSQLPENLVFLIITAPKGSVYDLKFGEEFARFKNLEKFSLENCVTEFPTFLKKLDIEILEINDPRVKKVPDWVGDMKLNFLTISNQTYIDPKIKEKLETREKRFPLDFFALTLV
jgi:hypothetical protein